MNNDRKLSIQDIVFEWRASVNAPRERLGLPPISADAIALLEELEAALAASQCEAAEEIMERRRPALAALAESSDDDALLGMVLSDMRTGIATHRCEGERCESWADARARLHNATPAEESAFVAGWHSHAERLTEAKRASGSDEDHTKCKEGCADPEQHYRWLWMKAEDRLCSLRCPHCGAEGLETTPGSEPTPALPSRDEIVKAIEAAGIVWANSKECNPPGDQERLHNRYADAVLALIKGKR